MENGDLLKAIKDAVITGDLEPSVKDSLVLAAMIALYNDVGEIKSEILELKKILPMYKVLVVVGTTLLGLIVTLMWSLLTNQISITIP